MKKCYACCAVDSSRIVRLIHLSLSFFILRSLYSATKEEANAEREREKKDAFVYFEQNVECMYSLLSNNFFFLLKTYFFFRLHFLSLFSLLVPYTIQ